jgi:hypothetical protein
VNFTVEIEREDRWGPFTYALWISPAPRFGPRTKFAWTRRGAEAIAHRWIKRAQNMGPKQGGDKVVISTIGGQS